MRFLASWWERIPSRVATSALVAVFVAVGLFGALSPLFARILGNYWE